MRELCHSFARLAYERERLELTRRLEPDVVVTDIEMPERSGLERAAEIRRLALRARVIPDVITKVGAANRTESARISREKGWL